MVLLGAGALQKGLGRSGGSCEAMMTSELGVPKCGEERSSRQQREPMGRAASYVTRTVGQPTATSSVCIPSFLRREAPMTQPKRMGSLRAAFAAAERKSLNFTTGVGGYSSAQISCRGLRRPTINHHAWGHTRALRPQGAALSVRPTSSATGAHQPHRG